MAEARELSHSYVGTEHLLLGLLRAEKGIAADVLTELGLTLKAPVRPSGFSWDKRRRFLETRV